MHTYSDGTCRDEYIVSGDTRWITSSLPVVLLATRLKGSNLPPAPPRKHQLVKVPSPYGQPAREQTLKGPSTLSYTLFTECGF